jgi:hypothetical protein
MFSHILLFVSKTVFFNTWTWNIKFMNAQQAKLVHLFKTTKENVKNNMWLNICISMHLLVYCVCKQYTLMQGLGTYTDYSFCICLHHWSEGVFDDFWWCSWLCRIGKCVSLLVLLFYGICCHIWWSHHAHTSTLTTTMTHIWQRFQLYSTTLHTLAHWDLYIRLHTPWKWWLGDFTVCLNIRNFTMWHT